MAEIKQNHADPSVLLSANTHPDIENLVADVGNAEQNGTAGPEHEYITGFKLLLLGATLTLITFLMMLDSSIIVTAIPQITTAFHSLGDIGWYGSAYLVANCAIQPLTGKFYTYFNLKYTYLFFLAIFEIGSALCGAAQSSKMLIVGRSVAGLGVSGLSNGALTILGAAVPMHKRPVVIGMIMSVSQIGIACGPVIGGALTEYVSWRWCFYINLPVGAVASVVLLVTKIPNGSNENTSNLTVQDIVSKLDLIGFCLFAPLATMFLLALEWGGTTYSWSSATVIGLFCGAFGTLIVYGAWEYRVGDAAMIPLSVVRRRVVWCSCLVIFFFYGTMMIFSYHLPLYFQVVKGISPALSGVYTLPGILGQIGMAAISGLLMGKWGYYLPWIVLSTMLCIVGAGLISTFTPHTSTAAWVCYQLLAGVGRGCGMQMPVIAIQNILPPKQHAVGMSLAIFAQTLGGALCLAIAEAIFTQSLVAGLKTRAPSVNPQTVVAAGALGVRQAVPPEVLPEVLKAYSLAIDDDFYLAIGVSAGAFIFCWGMGWYNIGKKDEDIIEKDTQQKG